MKEKKHEVDLLNSTNTNMVYPYTTTPGNFPQNTCENLLPCGVCKLTGQMCPKHLTEPYVTWTCNNEVK